jgi:hypothetical protein
VGASNRPNYGINTNELSKVGTALALARLTMRLKLSAAAKDCSRLTYRTPYHPGHRALPRSAASKLTPHNLNLHLAFISASLDPCTHPDMANEQATLGPLTVAPAPWTCKCETYWLLFYASCPLPENVYDPLEAASVEFSDPAVAGEFRGGLGMIQIVRYSETPVGV